MSHRGAELNGEPYLAGTTKACHLPFISVVWNSMKVYEVGRLNTNGPVVSNHKSMTRYTQNITVCRDDKGRPWLILHNFFLLVKLLLWQEQQLNVAGIREIFTKRSEELILLRIFELRPSVLNFFYIKVSFQ